MPKPVADKSVATQWGNVVLNLDIWTQTALAKTAFVIITTRLQRHLLPISLLICDIERIPASVVAPFGQNIVNFQSLFCSSLKNRQIMLLQEPIIRLLYLQVQRQRCT
jgi:hypothetical protein